MELILTEDSKFLKIVECTQHEYDQLTLSLTKKIESWRFHPLVKKGLWDGTVTFLKVNLIPSGLWYEVKSICEKFGFQFKIKGIRNLFDENIDNEEFNKWCEDLFSTHEKIKPRDYQIATAYNILKYRRCLAELATSAGKTLIMFLITSYLLEVKKVRRILFIVPNVSLVIQATEDFDEYNSVRRIPLKVQQIYAGVKIKPSSNIVIGTYQSLVKKGEDYFKEFDAVLVDECHKIKSASIKTILDKCFHTNYKIGVSGTVSKEGTLDRLTLMASTGPIVYEVSAAYLQSKGHVSNCKVFITYLDYAEDDKKEAFYNISRSQYEKSKLFNLEQQYIISNNKRLRYVSDIISKINGNSLVLFYHVQYGKDIYNELRRICNKKIYYVDGGTDKDARELYKKKAEEGDDVIIVASFGTFSTGISINKIHNIFLTESFKSEIIIRQSIGRGLRLHSSKDRVNIIDFVDDFRYKIPDSNRTFKNYIFRHGEHRKSIYNEQQFPYVERSHKIQ